MKRLARAIVMAGVAALVVTGPTARSAQPAAGVISGESRETSWTGGPFGTSNPEGCLGPDDLRCDRFSLTVVAPQGILFTVSAQPGEDAANLDLFVFFPDGSEAGRATGPPAGESVVVEHRTDRGLGPYEVRVQPSIVGPATVYEGVARIQTSAGTGLD